LARMAFIDSPLDRDANGRADADVIKQRQKHPKARFLQLFGDAVRLEEGQLFTAHDGAVEGAIYLGEDLDRNPWFAISRNTDGKMSALRPLMVEGTIQPAQLSILAQARSLVHWHERHGFCAVCGHKTEMADAGYRRPDLEVQPQQHAFNSFVRPGLGHKSRQVVHEILLFHPDGVNQVGEVVLGVGQNECRVADFIGPIGAYC